MLVREMSTQQCRDLLSRLGMGHLACARNNQPYVIPVYFAYETDRLYALSTFGQKIEWMRANPLVCLQADEVHSHFEWQSVIVRGRYEEFWDTPEYNESRRQAQASLEKRFLWWQTAYAANQPRQSHPATPIFYCIHIDEITGHRAVPDETEVRGGFTRR